ncbi:hypothetical protein [Streptomyces sp. NPDC051016]|uniref:hypothetical protein n=1 Tax=Streptomyces sp. NPDC051016 TaxID=3365638 RepID=UPI00379E3F6F
MARIAYHGTRVAHLHPADAVLNLPEGMHSHGPARLAAIESARSSFADAFERINAATGTGVGHRQVQELAAGAAADIDVFYDALAPAPCTDATPLIVSVDGKGVVIKPETLREDTAKAAAAKGGNAMRTTRAARRTFYRPSAKRRESAAQPKVGHGENSHTAKTLCARPLEQLVPVRCPDQQ